MRFNTEGGSRNFRFSPPASHSPLHEYLGLVRSGARPRDGYFLRAESFYNVATAAEEYGVNQFYGGDSLHAQSHGESFMALVLNRLKGKEFLLGYPGAEILQFGSDAISPVDYKATEHYVVTRAFLEQPERMLRELMEPDRNQ